MVSWLRVMMVDITVEKSTIKEEKALYLSCITLEKI